MAGYEMHFKIIDGIFHYPNVMPDRAIELDEFRNLLKRKFDYQRLTGRHDLIFVFPNMLGKRALESLIKSHENKKIVFVYCGENIFGRFNLMLHAYTLLKKLRIPAGMIERALFRKMWFQLLSIPSPYQVDTYFKNVVSKAKPNHFFILTNDISGNENIFFAPYFFFFCRDRLNKLAITRATPSKKKFCAFIVSNPNSVERLDFFRRLSAYKRVDSFGKILNNESSADILSDHIIVDAQRNDRIFYAYKFVICFENSSAKGYITEKLINAIAGGAIPVYRGAPDIGSYFNLARIINFDTYGTYDRMIERIIQLDGNDDLYEDFINQPIFAKGQKTIEQANRVEDRLEKFITDVINKPVNDSLRVNA